MKAYKNWVGIKTFRDPRNNIAEFGALIVDTTWDPYAHAIVAGEVAMVSEPEFLTPSYLDLSLLDNNGEAPLEFECDVRVEVGDVVYFNLLSVKKSMQAGRYVLDGDDVIVFIRYDRIYAGIREEEVYSVNGFILAQRLSAHTDDLDVYLARQNRLGDLSENSAVVMASSLCTNDFWEIVQNTDPYRDHGFVDLWDIIWFREQAGRRLENEVVKHQELNLIRLREKDVYARVRNGVVEVNEAAGYRLVELLPAKEDSLVRIKDGDTMRGRLSTGEIAYFKTANIRTIEYQGQIHTFVTDCPNTVEIQNLKILC